MQILDADELQNVACECNGNIKELGIYSSGDHEQTTSIRSNPRRLDNVVDNILHIIRTDPQNPATNHLTAVEEERIAT